MNIVKIVKIGSMILSIGGMIGSAWAGGKENEQKLAELVSKAINK